MLRRLSQDCRTHARRLLDALRPLRPPTIPPPLPLVSPQPSRRTDGRALRVLLQVEHFDRGGLERVVLDLATHLSRSDFAPQILVLGAMGAAAHAAHQTRIPILLLPQDESRAGAYARLLHDEQIDIVNAHYSLFGSDQAHAEKIPFVQTVHSSYVWESDANVQRYRAADAHTSAYICVSDSVADYTIKRFGIPREKLHVCRNGVDVASWTASAAGERATTRAQFGFKPDDFVVLTSAAVTNLKGHLPLIRAARHAQRQAPQLRLLFVGGLEDGRYVRRVRAEAASTGLGQHVVFAGHHAEPRAVYQAADAFALPSFVEGWSIALAEAACVGLPLLATDVGAAGQILPAVGGRLIAPAFGTLAYDPRSFAVATLRRHPAFEATLAEGLLAISKLPPHRADPHTLESLLGAETAYAAHAAALRSAFNPK